MTRPINTMTTMRLPGGQDVGFVDWSDRPLYSVADLLTGATDERIPLFNYIEGDSVSGTQNLSTKRTATLRDTNISTPGAMASTEEMLVYAIKPEVQALATDTEDASNAETAEPRYPLDPIPASWQLMNLMRLALLELRVTQKVMHQAPFGYFNVGFGPFSGATQNAIGGLPSQQSVRAVALPIHIGGQEKYEVAIVNPSGAALNLGLSDNANLNPSEEQTNRLFQVRIVLDGLYKRPVA